MIDPIGPVIPDVGMSPSGREGGGLVRTPVSRVSEPERLHSRAPIQSQIPSLSVCKKGGRESQTRVGPSEGEGLSLAKQSCWVGQPLLNVGVPTLPEEPEREGGGERRDPESGLSAVGTRDGGGSAAPGFTTRVVETPDRREEGPSPSSEEGGLPPAPVPVGAGGGARGRGR